MRRLSPIILLLGLTFSLFGQSPHGADLKMDCAACHTSVSWEIPFENWNFEPPGKAQKSKTTGWPISEDTLKFNHFNTAFSLTGQHAMVDCRQCHETLVFNEARTDCISCHTDMHRMTVGEDCARCHSTQTWIVDDITEIHQENGFPLLGTHAVISCNECHTSASNLEFNRIGNDCINCHQADFDATTNPNHNDAGFPTDCTQCHSIDANDWSSEEINHDFFPLTKGHEINDCAACHIDGSFSNTPTDCFACHETDFENTLSPKHQSAGFPTDCAQCHTTDLGWMPAEYTEHDVLHFPIYSGAHDGEWMKCAECHNNESDYTQFTCINCHTNPETDEEHEEVSGYVYENTACLACHPTGNAEDAFDHNNTNFPLTGEHIEVDCIQCHADGYQGTPTNCDACHIDDFNATINPDHEELGLPMDCAQCHTTDPDWMPASFDIHDDFYPLNGAHATIANDCAACHNGDYNNTPNTCFGCHSDDYNNAMDPNHAMAQFPTDCTTCHTEDSWIPSTMDHDAQYFPIYSGEHNGEWSECTDCHTNPSNYAEFSCTNCHINPETDDEHDDVGGYVYENTACLACHPTGDSDNLFNHNTTDFPLTGAHLDASCIDCHSAGYAGTPTDCASCHTVDFNATANPNHNALGLSTDCASCHTTDPGWNPATFANHDDYYALNGAHTAIANDCASCHNGDYNNTPNTCIGCHTQDFNATADPDHADAQFPTDCTTCHTEDAWIPSTFDHNNHYLLTGGHELIQDDCVACHNGDYNNTPTECAGCHTQDFTATVNPDHEVLGFPTDCASCHTTAPDWMPASFDIHDDFYPLNGAHATIANDCAACHNGDYTNTPNTCFGCHSDDYNNTTDPNHATAQFPTDCTTCHTEDSWIPSTLDHDAQYFPIYSGEHNGEWSECTDCHTNPSNYAEFSCTNCHINPETDDEHDGVGGYTYQSTACLACHPSGDADLVFDHNTTNFPLTGAHLDISCLECHSAGYAGTPTECAACHTTDFNTTNNPDHNALGLSTDCATCHTTDPGWEPAAFSNHNDYYALNGAHAAIANDCAACHNGDYNNTPTDCMGCHTQDFNATTDPDHAAAQFPTDCTTCHTEDAWIPSSFDHNNYYPLTGGHELIQEDCAACHNGDYNNTPTECVGCHTQDFTATVNPDHEALAFPTDCATCHTTTPDWMPASFDIHDDFYPLNGAHATIANDCAACHNGDYTNTPNTCFGCHNDDFNNTSDPSHVTGQFPTDCTVCHTEDAWIPSTLDHDVQHFPIYSGAHDGEWNECIDCHTNPSNYAEFSCTNCHINPETDDEHDGVGGYTYQSTACLACHPSGDADLVFDHNTTNFPLTGAHLDISCLECHSAGYAGTPTDCASCHTVDFNATANPNHNALGFSNDCASCHTSDTGWEPATFVNHDDYYALNGAHAAIADNCASCHNGDYNNTPNTCVGCHSADFNTTTDPDHQTAQFPMDCTTCHSEDAWVPSSFEHDNYYPLTGGHELIQDDCVACHNGDYTNTPTDCAACHTQDFTATVNPDHEVLGFPTDCASCHTTTPDWMPASFDIHDDYYPLNGAHATITNDCAACHNGDYTNTPNTCFGCHSDDYNGTTDPNHATAQFPTDCMMCHTEDSWIPSTLEHDAQYFPIYSGEHNGEWSECTDCHTNPSNYAEFSCTNCHINPETDDEHDGVGGYVYESTACLACHPAGDTDNLFDHNTTNFPLTGAHLDASCIDCHSTGYAGTPTDCASCHTVDFNATANPNHNALGFSNDCASCHTSDTGWEPATFVNHDDYYALNGAHAAIADNCASCHNGDYNNTPNTCVGCHSADFNTTTDPDHQTAQFPMDCTTCHSEDAWVPSSFEHDNYYPLTGGHELIQDDCVACHNGDYTNTPTDCAACHTQDFTATANPDHEVLGFPTDCASCHSTTPDWMPASFDIHDDYYPLNGAHATIANDCAACHNGDYTNTPNTCFGCHSDDYNGTTAPNHAAAQFPTDCTTCHSEDAWIPSTFDHDIYYPLTGGHELIQDDCVACHNGDYTNTPTDCAGCHTQDFTATANPDHEVLGFPTDCASCHTTTPDWMPASFDIHDDYYPLNGAHATITNDCAACHNGDYTNTPNTCFGCHSDDYNGTTDPNHTAAQFPTDCTTCHTEDAWIPSTFDHDIYYPLTGGHELIQDDCAACHNGDYNNTPNTCFGCHSDDYNATSNPNHAAANFPTDCESCHTEDGWIPSTFDHSVYFPFTGAHIPIANDCNICHNGDYTNTPNTCDGCHITDYNTSFNPSHTSLGLPTDCASCHTTDPDWMPASFDIHNDYYVLNGAHAAIANDCATCHNGDYNNTPNTCFGCHSDDYNATSNPNHAAANFPTDCESCHTEDGWIPSTFDHSVYFPFTGAHIPIANDCNICHNGDYTNTPNTCDGCHITDYNTSFNPSHTSLGLPTDCASCHTTDPDWMPASFDIHNDYYVLNGAHAAIANDCATCHNGDYNNTPNTCLGCHSDDYNATSNPNHAAANFPTDCTACHTENTWIPSTFNHDIYYPIVGAHAAIANDCNACHNGDYTNTPNTCFGCHSDDYNNTNNPNHASAGFPTSCEDCHSQNAWIPATFDHDAMYFPIYSGKHEGEWNQCTDCHTTGNYNVFNCLDCHNDQAGLANDHDEVSGYIYESNACFACHPDGSD